MFTYVPHSSVKRITSRDIRIMAPVNCLKCKQLCVKPLQLPGCGHVFCKKCLNEYFNSLSSWTDEPDCFPCPECGGKVVKPDLPISKWTKQFRIYKTARFFTNGSDALQDEDKETGSDSVTSRNIRMTTGHRDVKKSTLNTRSKSLCSQGQVSSIQEEEDKGSDVVRIRTASSFKHRSFHRTAMRLSMSSFEKAFESKVSSDKNDCVYFGGDTMHNGNLLLSDWLNLTVKMFEPSGQFVCKIKLDEAPLDVTDAGKDMIVVSFGSRSNMVLFLKYKESEEEKLKLMGGNKLPGYLYSTTRYEGTCIGIFEKDGCKSCSIVEVTIGKSGKKPGAPRESVKDFINPEKNFELSSESGICYNHNDRRLYVTSRRKLLCFRKDRRLIFRESYHRTETDLHILGSVTCDERGVVYIASDSCILRVSKDGALISVLESPEDPYHILTRHDQRKLVVLSKQSEVLFFNIEKKKKITLSS